MVFENVALPNSTRFKTSSLKFSLVRLRKRFIESFSLDSFYFRILSLPLLLSMCNYFYYLINLLFFSSFNLTELVEKIELNIFLISILNSCYLKEKKKKKRIIVFRTLWNVTRFRRNERIIHPSYSIYRVFLLLFVLYFFDKNSNNSLKLWWRNASSLIMFMKLR